MLAATSLVAVITALGMSGAFASVTGSSLLQSTSGDMIDPDALMLLGVWVAGGLLVLACGAIAVARSVRRLRRQVEF